MIHDIKIEVRLAQKDNENKLLFAIFNERYFGPQGEEYSKGLRETLSLTEDETLALLMGDLSKDEAKSLVEDVSAKISQWFLGEDLKLFFPVIIRGLSGDDHIRLIFSPHASLRTIDYDLCGLPLEMIRPNIDSDPYVLSPQVSSITHLLEKPLSSSPSLSSLAYPLRVLIVRSNPPGLGLAVPEAGPIREEILALGKQISPEAVEVDVLSSEPSINRPATWSAFTEQLDKTQNEPYDILIYLGHGSLMQDGPRQVGALQLEAEDGGGAKHVLGRELVTPLTGHKVPVVLFVACLTAAQMADADKKRFEELYKKRAPEWIRGSQGVAQTLINGGTGTQVAIGMRYRLEVEDALLFLKKFFEGLLNLNKGNVEASVQLARRALKNLGYPTAYSAPVVFSSKHEEPLFSFLTGPPPPIAACQKPEGEWEARNIVWKNIESMPWETRSDEFKNIYLELLKEVEKTAINTATRNAALIMPEVVPPEKPDWLVKKPSELIKVPVMLYGSLAVNKVDVLEGRFIVDREDVTILGAQPSKELEESGYGLSITPKARQIEFTIKPSGNGDTKNLQDIKLFEVNIHLGTAFATRYNIQVSGIRSEPGMKICPGTNAVIVPPPLSGQ
jgi:hypothetical protein